MIEDKMLNNLLNRMIRRKTDSLDHDTAQVESPTLMHFIAYFTTIYKYIYERHIIPIIGSLFRSGCKVFF